MDLNGKTKIITGAGRGIGNDISLNLAGESCNVVIVSRPKSNWKRLKKKPKNWATRQCCWIMTLLIEKISH